VLALICCATACWPQHEIGGKSRKKNYPQLCSGSEGEPIFTGRCSGAAVSGTDPLETRPGFPVILERIEGDGIKLVIVEDARQFARSVIAQELGVLATQACRVRGLTRSGKEPTSTDNPAKR
jgi:hypothetical protein